MLCTVYANTIQVTYQNLEKTLLIMSVGLCRFPPWILKRNLWKLKMDSPYLRIRSSWAIYLISGIPFLYSAQTAIYKYSS